MAHQHSSSSFTFFQLKILETMLCKSCFLFFFMFAFLSVLFCFFEWNGYCAKSWNMIIIIAYTTAAVGWRETGWWKYDIAMGVALTLPWKFDIAMGVSLISPWKPWYCQAFISLWKYLWYCHARRKEKLEAFMIFMDIGIWRQDTEDSLFLLLFFQALLWLGLKIFCFFLV